MGEVWAPAAAPGAAGSAAAAGPGAAGGPAVGTRLIEPLHLVAPFLLVLGGGLFLLRLVPLLAGLGARLAERGRGTALYLALVQLSRAGFLIAAGVSVLGFWLHAALGAGARVVQFGALRAMGLGRWQLTAAVALEQGLAVHPALPDRGSGGGPGPALPGPAPDAGRGGGRAGGRPGAAAG
ncbi:MAG: hypothetical protein L6E13_07955, partial [Firmicutes bacterium]|nr:hypothetical protein [Bacillota bacterium]